MMHVVPKAKFPFCFVNELGPREGRGISEYCLLFVCFLLRCRLLTFTISWMQYSHGHDTKYADDDVFIKIIFRVYPIMLMKSRQVF